MWRKQKDKCWCSLLSHTDTSPRVSPAFDALDQHQALKLSFLLHILVAAVTDNFVEH